MRCCEFVCLCMCDTVVVHELVRVSVLLRCMIAYMHYCVCVLFHEFVHDF